MEKRSARVSEAQWSILLEFLERHPSLARARGYNNSARGRHESLRLWDEVALSLNSEGSGTIKTSKDWSIYVSNYKSKLKKIVADMNADANGTGGGPSRGIYLSDMESRFLAVMGPGFGQTAPLVRVEPFPVEVHQQPTTADTVGSFQDNAEDVQHEVVESVNLPNKMDGRSRSPIIVRQPVIETPAGHDLPDDVAPHLPRRTRQTRYRSRLLAPLDEARRILSQVEMQRAAADAASAQALALIGQSLSRLADAVDRYLARTEPQ